MARPVAMLLLAAVAAAGPLVVPASAAEPAPAADRTEIEAVVRDLLKREPELVLQAIEELQRRREAEAAKRQQAVIAEKADTLFADPADPVGGEADGSVTVVEFFDYNCGYCRQMVPTLRAVMAEDDDLRVVFKELPILGPDSVEATKAAFAAARQDRYLDMHFALMAADDLSGETITAAAKRIGLDLERFEADKADPAIAMQINANYQLAQELGIQGTPAFVIGDAFVPGAIDPERLRQLVAEARSADG